MPRILAFLLIMCSAWWSTAYAMDPPVAVTMQNATASTTTNGTPATVSGYATVGVQVVISATGTVNFEGTLDNTNWLPATCILSSDASAVTSATASGLYQCNVAGFTQLRGRISANTGTITVKSLATTSAVRSGVGGTTGWPTSSANKEITWANSLPNAMRVGDGVTPLCLYTDATIGPTIRPCTDSNTETIIPANFNWCLYDIEGASCIYTVDPDAASTLAMHQIAAAYRWKKSVWFGAGALSTDGTQCAAPAEVTINSGPKIWTVICTENDASTMYWSFKSPDNWDGGTFTVDHVYIQTAADTGSMLGELSAQCHGNGETVDSTWGSVVELDDAAVTGSNKNDMITSTAVTPAGTCAAGDMVYFRWQYDATGNPTTAAATLNHVGFRVEYSEVGPSQ